MILAVDRRVYIIIRLLAQVQQISALLVDEPMVALDKAALMFEVCWMLSGGVIDFQGSEAAGVGLEAPLQLKLAIRGGSTDGTLKS